MGDSTERAAIRAAPLGGSMDIAENSNGVFVYYAVECVESVKIMIAN